MKACSFLPAATVMIQDMGLEEFLYGVTFECPSVKPIVVHSVLENKNYSSLEINTIVSQAKAQGKSLYYVDEELLRKISPDIIFTQDVCDVCQIDTGCVQKAISGLEKQPQLISLIPTSLADVFSNAATIARALGKEEQAARHLTSLKERSDRIIDTVKRHGARLKKVMLMEWVNPVYNCGHWIPDMIETAGGTDMLSSPCGYSTVISWEKIIQYDPEVLVIAPCGFKPLRTLEEMDKLTGLKGWDQLRAVKNDAVFIADGDLFTCPSTRLVEGIELLASLFHPELFSLPAGLSENVLHVTPSFRENRVVIKPV